MIVTRSTADRIPNCTWTGLTEKDIKIGSSMMCLFWLVVELVLTYYSYYNKYILTFYTYY